ncbi:MAG: hypothetical protein RR552_07260 [Oscillospiraceae bacterium]
MDVLAKKFLKYFVPTGIIIVMCVFLFIEPTISALAVRQSISLCAEIVIPSLFPFMIISSFIIKSGISELLGKLFNPLTRFAFRLPGESAGAIIMSFVGGYPIGAKMTAELLKEGKITINQAQRMNIFCLNAGPAFVIGSVGTIMLGSTKAGVILYFSNVISSLILGVLTIVLDDKTLILDKKKEKLAIKSPITAFVNSVADSGQTMLMICSWVLIFASICSLVGTIFANSTMSVSIKCILEVTNGVAAAAKILPLPAVCAILSFGGICVHCQVFSFIRTSGLKLKYFYTARCISAGISAIVCMQLLKVFPCEVQTFATSSNIIPTAFSVSAPAAAVLLIMSAILIFQVDTDKKVC